MNGRTVIKTSEDYITVDNVVDVVEKAFNIHINNSQDIDYLLNYYKGKQDIIERTKEIRPEICNKIVENRANEIVSFKVGYLCGEPIQYISRNSDENISEAIGKLNELMFAEDKASKDQEIVEWQMICGSAYRMILPDKKGQEDEAPFEIYTLDPRDTFVVYSNDIDSKPMLAVKYRMIEKNATCFPEMSVYTENDYFLIENSIIKKQEGHALGMIPIIEYPANSSRLGSFEIVLPLLNAINTIDSNRIDGMEQFIQGFIKFINCDIDEEQFAEFKKLGAIKVKSWEGLNADVNFVNSELNQVHTQTLKDDLYNSILTICGMPNRNGGSSTSDTGAAVLLRDGWSLAEARAKDSEHYFKKAEKQMLKLVFRICKVLSDFDLKLKDVDMKFTRRNYEAIQSKSQVLISMLQQDKIHPMLAFSHCGMFTDPESAFIASMKYYAQQQERELNTNTNNERELNKNTEENITEDDKDKENEL